MEKFIKFGTAILLLLIVGFFIVINLTSTNAGNQNESVQILQPNTKTPTVTFLAVGDIMLSRNVAAQIKKSNNPLLPFSKMVDILKSTDFNFGNLESPFSGSTKFNSSPTLVFNTPPVNVKGLKEYNFNILSLANNHAFDQGLKGLLNTKLYLSQNSIASVGTGKNIDEAWQPAILEYNDIKLGFIATSYSALNDNAKANKPNVARMQDISRLKSTLDELKPKVDFIIVSMHGGAEYTYKPNDLQKTFARIAIDAGADMVIGAHPHWIQPIEKYNSKYIFYSLGNFIFDQEWSKETKEGLTAKITIVKNWGNTSVSKVELIPIIIENFSTPRPATTKESLKMLKNINLTSTNLE